MPRKPKTIRAQISTLRVVNGIVFALGTAITLYVTLSDNFSDNKELRIIIGLLFVVVTLLANLWLLVKEGILQIKEDFEERYSLTKTEELIVSLGTDRGTFEDIARHIVQADTKYWKDRLIREQKKSIIEETLRRSRCLDEGQFETYFWSCSVLATSVTNMRQELIGLSPWSKTDKEWWDSSDGQKFFDINKKVLNPTQVIPGVNQKNRVITRIFVYDENAEYDRAELEAEMRKHYDAGVKVHHIAFGKLREQHLRTDQDAMAVLDQKLAFWAETRSGRLAPDKNFFSLKPEEVSKRLNELRLILKHSTPFDPAHVTVLPLAKDGPVLPATANTAARTSDDPADASLNITGTIGTS